MPTLDLRDRGWIPVRERDGTIREVGMREALNRAHDLRDIRDALPTVEFGLYRLLIAVVMDIYKFRELRDLEDLLEAGRFDAARAEAYFTANDGNFDLFDAKHPFLQFAEMKEDADKPLAGLLPSVPSGTNANHFHHALDSDFGVCPEAAARLLTTIAPFMTAGGAGLAPSINGSPPWYALVTGGTLFQTLCLNCCVVHLPQGHDGTPSWRRKGTFAQERRTSASLLEGLTWQPRRILLMPGEPGCCSLTGRQTGNLVRSMKFGPGAGAGFTWTDPSVAYKLDIKGPLVVRPQEGKQVWRDVGPLALLREQDVGKGDERTHYVRPAVVEQYVQLYQDLSSRGLVPDSLRLTLYGMRTDLKMKVFEWQRESMEAVPARLVLFELFGSTAQDEINRANKVDSALARALKHAYPRDGKGNKKAFESRIDYARRGFWNGIRPHFMALLTGMALADPLQLDVDAKPLVAAWKTRLRNTGYIALEEAIKDLDTEANMILRTEVLVRNEFRKGLYFALDAVRTDPNTKPTSATTVRAKAMEAIAVRKENSEV